jgi:hypothetical protein
MRFRRSTLVVGLALVLFGGAIAWMKAPRLRYREEIRATEELAAKIEAFRRIHGRLPDENQFPETEGRLFYKPENDGYVVGFNLGFDDYESFDSRTRRWSFDDRR